MSNAQRLFGFEGSNEFARHACFLERARLERERKDYAASRAALAAFLVARLVERWMVPTSSEEERQSYAWQLESTRRYIDELDEDRAETRHLAGIVDVLDISHRRQRSAVRMGLTAFAYYLEHEGRLPEALTMLALAADAHGDRLPPADLAAVALFAGRLHRLQAHWDLAITAYEAAEQAATEVGDLGSILRSRLGRVNVLRGQGNLPAARKAAEKIIAEAGANGLNDVQSLAYADLAVVLEKLNRPLEALQANYRAFTLSTDPINKMRVLGDIGVYLHRLGYYDVARLAFEIVINAHSGFLVRTNARLELMELESAVGNRLAFERHRHELREAAGRMPPSMAIDYRYKVGVGLARFGQLNRAREAWAEGMALAEEHRLNEWYFRLERVMHHTTEWVTESVVHHVPPAEDVPPAIAEMAAGLQDYAEMATA